jgi:glyoxylase-like metal-dependent hydrolase (beta-lactamase superfamily II)
MRTLSLTCVIAGLVSLAGTGAAQTSALLDENAVVKVSPNVYAIMGFPNVGIIVGSHAIMVVDTGMGPRNGEAIMRAVRKLTQTQRLYLTTTHYHPEHASGLQGFPAGTVLIRPAAQQDEMDRHGMEFIDMFRSRNAQYKELLADVVLRTADVVFDNHVKVDLGNVTVRLLWMGPAHTRGDELIFVDPDRTLIPGDIVENKLVPNMPTADASPKNWIAILDQLGSLSPRYVLPDHGTLGGGELIPQERAFLAELRTRTLELQQAGKTADEATTTVTAEMQKKYPDWTGFNAIANAVKRVYAEGE